LAAGDEQARQGLAAILSDDKSPDPAQIAENRELCELIQKGIRKLDDEHRAIIVLRDIEGMDYAQIAEVLGAELGTVKSRLSRARAALRQILEAL
jgi:RNA polymerase sigma-70 factor (ECF subfamily)